MELRKYDVTALGELLIDFTSSGISGQGNPLFEANPGGAPCNVLAMLQKLGKKTAFIGKVGNDIFGKMLCEKVQATGIDISSLVVDEQVNTTLAFVQTLEDGDREFSFYRNPGADMMLTASEVDEDKIRNSRIFHFGTLSMTANGVEEATKRAITIAKESGCILSFDPNLRPPLWSSEAKAKEKIAYGLSVCDILKISDNEIEFMTGTTDIDANPNTIETIGAGDTFCANALNYVLEHGMDDLTEENLKELLAFANAAASLITTKKGALCVMPTKEEIEEYMK